MSWREPSCPHCGAVNRNANKRRVRRKKKKLNPLFLLLPAAVVIALAVILWPKGEAKPEGTEPQIPVPSQEEAAALTEPSRPQAQTPSGTPRPVETIPDFVPDSANYGSPEEFAQSPDCTLLMTQNKSQGNGKPERYTVFDLDRDGKNELLLLSGPADGYRDLLILSPALELRCVVSFYGDPMFDPEEKALAYEPLIPQGDPGTGNYSGWHNFCRLEAGSDKLTLLFSVGMDEGIPMKTVDGENETVTLDVWESYVDRLQVFVWKTI